MTHTIDSRRFDVDWLRSLAFILLIFYHIGMFYVFDWGWHVKSAYQSEFLQNLMLLLNRWRMPLIFLISGIALSLVEPKINASKLLKLRFVRIFIPLVIGMYLIVPPQLYFELVQKEGFNGGYLTFLSFYINPNTDMFTQYHGSPLGLLTWNHLWYLTYLWHYTLIYLALRPLLTRIDWSTINQKVGAGKLFLIWWSWVVIVIFWLKADNPITHNLVDDWYNHAISFSIFLLGYCLPKCKIGWDQIITHRRKFLIGALIGYAATLILHEGRLGRFLDSSGVDVAALASHIETWLVINSIIAMNLICWLFTLLGYAGRYLTKSNRFLNYMNEAILPWYILHQTMTIIFAVWLAKLQLGPVFEPILLILLTFSGCFVGYEIIKRFKVTRFIFGLKINDAKTAPKKCANSSESSAVSSYS